jgi:D-erythrulose 1-phosphate 3-epimerase
MFGVNLSFAVKRWVEPEVWTKLVAEDLGVTFVQFSFDLLDPWWDKKLSMPLAKRIRKATKAHDITIHSAFVGLAAYTYNALLHPEKEGRKAAVQWYKNAIDLAAEMGAGAVGGPVGGMSVTQAAKISVARDLYAELIDTLHSLTGYAKKQGLAGFLIEQTPLTREIPWNLSQYKKLSQDLSKTALPVTYTIDLGHVLYKPLYKHEAKLAPWLNQHVGLIHLQQTDGMSDSHWGFTRKGIVDLQKTKEQLAQAGLADVPVVLEVFYPFELDDESVIKDVKKSIQVCKKIFG